MPRRKKTDTEQPKETCNAMVAEQEMSPPEPVVVDWNERVPKDCFVINHGRTDETDIEKVAECEKLITLEGFDHVANERGWVSVTYPTVIATDKVVTVVCEIIWESNEYGESFKSSGVGDAHDLNTSGFGKIYLASIAENRAFERAVKKGLRIKTLGADEIKDARAGRSYSNENVGDKFAQQMLELMNKKGISFDAVKKRLVAERFPNAEALEKVADIPSNKILDLINQLKKVKG